MELRIVKGFGEEIHIFGAVEYAREEPINALWLAWHLGESKIRAVYFCIKGAPKEADLTVNVGDEVGEIIEQIRAIL